MVYFRLHPLSLPNQVLGQSEDQGHPDQRRHHDAQSRVLPRLCGGRARQDGGSFRESEAAFTYSHQDLQVTYCTFVFGRCIMHPSCLSLQQLFTEFFRQAAVLLLDAWCEAAGTYGISKRKQLVEVLQKTQKNVGSVTHT